MRNLSAFEEERRTASRALTGPVPLFEGELWDSVEQVRHALYVVMILTYAQGMAQLRVASEKYEYDLDLEAVARIWRGGCIIRSALLEKMRAAYKTNPDLPNLLLDPDLGQAVESRQGDLRTVVRIAAELGIPTPALAVSLAYFDGYRSAWLPANLIQAQRDYFGAHTYERIDAKGTFHTRWE
jgi:6-phosphogluconate dehydrogenase